MQAALLKGAAHGQAHVLAHGGRQKGGFFRVLRHQAEEGLNLIIQHGGVAGNVPAVGRTRFFQAAHFAADFVTLLFINAGQVGLPVAGQGHIGRVLQALGAIIPAHAGGGRLERRQGGRAFQQVVEVQRAPGGQVAEGQEGQQAIEKGL